MIIYNSHKDVREDIYKGNTSCSALVNYFLERIEDCRKLNAFVEVFTEEAIQKALLIDKKIAAGKGGRLAGMIIAIKDNICYKGHATEAASAILKGFKPLYSATVLDRLLEEDAIIIGRLNCDEFAMGGSNEHSVFGHVLNPHNTEHVSGGSSGGSAVAVAAGMCHAALGSDTGGSVRQPAAFCGVYGFKPTYGRVSRHGLIAYASSLDQIGVITRSVDDAALLLEVISGKDGNDSTSSALEVPDYSNLLKNKRSLRIAVFNESLNASALDPEIKCAVLELLDSLKNQGHKTESIAFTLLNKTVPAYYVLAMAEASSNLSRYSGLLYGQRDKSSSVLSETIRNSRNKGFGKEVKRRILSGTFILSSGYYDAYYTKAQKVRHLIKEELSKVFEKYDLIITPTTPTTAFRIGEIKDPVTMYLEDIFTVTANLTGVPAFSIPLNISSSGMPFGIQAMADKWNEVTLLQFAQYTNNLTKMPHIPEHV